MLNASFDGTFNNILRPKDVCFDKFKRVILSCRNMLESSAMDHNVHASKCLSKAIFIPYIPNEISNARVLFRRKNLSHFKLLEFVTTIDDQSLGLA